MGENAAVLHRPSTRLPPPTRGPVERLKKAEHVRHTAATLLGRLIGTIVVLLALMLARFGRIDRSHLG
jgi:hypothetical protein